MYDALNAFISVQTCRLKWAYQHCEVDISVTWSVHIGHENLATHMLSYLKAEHLYDMMLSETKGPFTSIFQH